MLHSFKYILIYCDFDMLWPLPKLALEQLLILKHSLVFCFNSNTSRISSFIIKDCLISVDVTLNM